MNLTLIEISQEIFQIRSQIMKSRFEVVHWKSFDHTFNSNSREQSETKKITLW